MIIECYSMDVYCDMPNCVREKNSEYLHIRGPDDFAGKNKTECDRQRKKHGWRKINGEDVCPECVAELKKKSSNQ